LQHAPAQRSISIGLVGRTKGYLRGVPKTVLH
jgi:hypothetical protein